MNAAWPGYREMQTTLEAARKQIAYSQTWGSLERIVQRTERALLQEVLEWHSITSSAESHWAGQSGRDMRTSVAAPCALPSRSGAEDSHGIRAARQPPFFPPVGI